MKKLNDFLLYLEDKEIDANDKILILFIAALEHLNKNGGVTCTTDNIISFDKGFQYSKNEKCFNNVIEAHEEFKRLYLERLKNEDPFYLGMYYGEENKLYVEKSYFTLSKKEALENLKTYNQETVLNWETMECIKA